MTFVKNVRNVVQNGMNKLTFVNPIIWGILPGLIFGILVLFLLITVFQIPVTGKSNQRICNNHGKCTTEIVSNRKNILFYILLPLILGIVTGTGIYKLVFYIKNPKTGAALVTTGFLRKAITGR